MRSKATLIVWAITEVMVGAAIAERTAGQGSDPGAAAGTGGPTASRPSQSEGTYVLSLTVTSTLPFPKVPMDPTIAFGDLIQKAGIRGFLDHSSIRIRDVTSEKWVPHAVERFDNGDTLKVEWVIQNPDHRQYEIHFATTAERTAPRPASYTPMIGVGDLLRYNAGVPRPVVPGYPSGLYDLTGDGLPDLVGVWNYGRRPGDRWDGVTVYPRVDGLDKLEFGDLFRAYEIPDERYSRADVGDFDRDGQPDIVFAPSRGGKMVLFRNSGRRHATRIPAFEASGGADRPSGSGWNVRVVDLDQDGFLDIVCGAGYPNAETGSRENTSFLKNTGARGWPPSFSDAGKLPIAGVLPAFFDVDGDGRIDAVSLVVDPGDPGLSGYNVAWQKNLGGFPPGFGEAQLLAEVNQAVWRPTDLAASNDGPQLGLIVQHHDWQKISFFTRSQDASGPPYLRFFATAGSLSAELQLSDQAWPYSCDWDGDGDWDLLVGGGYGWPRIVINEGTNERPAFSEARLIYSEGKPIRLLRNLILGKPDHWHNMGYPYPAYVDWDGDGLPDLMIPNETNRIFWYRNVGTKAKPEFGPQQLLAADGYLETPEKKAKSAQDALKAVYPKEEGQPFFWRTGAAFADFNGDGLMDLATHSGATRKLTLFTQFRDAGNGLQLRTDRPLKLTDGRQIDESVAGRSSGWTESFKAIDWNGDGLVDIVYSLAGKSGDTVYLLRNAGTRTDPIFVAPEPIRLFGEPINITAHGPNVSVGDLDGDGRPEVIGCTEWSVYAFYRGTALAMDKRPAHSFGTVRPVSGKAK